jgi:7-carboxy-7-deazaguanine synthase
MNAETRLSTDGIFFTLQGEGPLVGTPSIFVRLDTCNLHCKWGNTLCDAHYTSWDPSGAKVITADLCKSILDAMRDHKCKHVVITGGEPALQAETVRAIQSTVDLAGGQCTIETNGTIFVPGFHGLVCLSPKLMTSTPVGTPFEKVHERNRWKPEVIRRWISSHQYYFKFVIDREEDVEEVLALLKEVDQVLPDPAHVVFMPQGITAEEIWLRGRWVAEECKRLGVRFSPRLQIDIWGNKPGT